MMVANHLHYFLASVSTFIKWKEQVNIAIKFLPTPCCMVLREAVTRDITGMCAGKDFTTQTPFWAGEA